MILLMAFGLIMMMKNTNNLEIINSLHVHILKNTTRDGGGTTYTAYTVFYFSNCMALLMPILLGEVLAQLEWAEGLLTSDGWVIKWMGNTP